MEIQKNDVNVLRELARQTMAVANQEAQNQRRRLWSDFNSMKKHQVPVYVLDPQGMWQEVCPYASLKCEHPLLRYYENWLRLQMYHASFGDDFITEPWITVTPEYANSNPHWRSWGVEVLLTQIAGSRAFHLPEPIITKPEDLARLVAPYGQIDQEKTAVKIKLLTDAVGDIIPVIPDYYPQGNWGLSYILAYMLGPEQMLYQLCDNPEMVHELSRIISEGTLKIFTEAERQGWFTNCNHTFMDNAEIQAMPYSYELPNPGPLQSVTMKQHWCYDAAQEFESVGPEMYYEFMLRYQIPIYEKFGLTAYGCCENLEDKIKYLKKIPNLRRVAVTPWANAEKCARQLENKYVISWRPHPAEMVTNGFSPERIKSIVKQAKRIFESHDCYWEVNLKDFLSVEHEYDRLNKWVKVVREALAD